VTAAAGSGFIANTDFGWFSHVFHRAEPPEEVDFWQPSPHGFKAIPPGAPFFFRLGAPHKAIAGFGFFARYERVPVWLAWESFGDLNGTDTFAEMTARIKAVPRRSGRQLCISTTSLTDTWRMERRLDEPLAGLTSEAIAGVDVTYCSQLERHIEAQARRVLSPRATPPAAPGRR